MSEVKLFRCLGFTVVHHWLSQEGQSVAEAELCKRCKEFQEGLLYVCQPEKKGQRKCTPWTNMTGKLVTMNEEKTWILNNFFASVFTNNPMPLEWMDCKTGTRGAKSPPQ